MYVCFGKICRLIHGSLNLNLWLTRTHTCRNVHLYRLNNMHYGFVCVRAVIPRVVTASTWQTRETEATANQTGHTCNINVIHSAVVACSVYVVYKLPLVSNTRDFGKKKGSIAFESYSCSYAFTLTIRFHSHV